jgi:L-threonylcarbamoyladenylate synthase
MLVSIQFGANMIVLKATKKNIVVAAQVLRNGGLVVYPTETVYGLGCDPFKVEAVKRLLDVKANRSKPLPVLAARIADVENVAFVSQNGKRLAAKFWPGSLTLVFYKKPTFPDVVTSGWDSVGLRIPDHDVALRLIRLSGGLLVGSSANRTGEKPPRAVNEISDELKEMVDVVLDGGPAVQGMPSTVADLTSDKPRILREGPISLQAILDALTLGD